VLYQFCMNMFKKLERKAEFHHTLLTQRNRLLKQAFAVEEGRQETEQKTKVSHQGDKAKAEIKTQI